ncbi:hypothetical protein C8R43DRAFT_1053735 [Mycena crocata]|nr:hypothetical protein C8R43DRAFT_1053735 [Mycena crocata]
MPRSKLIAACGPTGCAQLVDAGCLHEWYGQNEPAKLLNMMQFTFPFCRRKPTVKTRVHAIFVTSLLRLALGKFATLITFCESS